MMSEQVNEIFGALSKAQGQMRGATKDATNPFFKARYSSLHATWEACRQALSDNGLSVTQVVTGSSPTMVLVTILGHSSGTVD